MTSVKRARLDVEHYGFVVDRRRALAEAFPSYAAVLRESPAHPSQRARTEQWIATMSTPEAREQHAARNRAKSSLAYQEAEADRFIARMHEKFGPDPVVDGPETFDDPYPDEPADMQELVQAAVINLRARYGGPST